MAEQLSLDEQQDIIGKAIEALDIGLAVNDMAGARLTLGYALRDHQDDGCPADGVCSAVQLARWVLGDAA